MYTYIYTVGRDVLMHACQYRAGEAVQNVQNRTRREQKHTEHTNRFE